MAAGMYRMYTHTHTHIVVFATRLRRGRAFLFQYKNIRTKQEDCLCLRAPPFIRYIDVTTPSPASALQVVARIADRAAQSGDLCSKHPADCASCANAPWDELRVWDPGD